MAKRCIIHIGMHKTGSTSIQRSLFRNPKLGGAKYIDMGIPNASEPIYGLFTQHPEKYNHYRFRNWSEAVINERKQQHRMALEQALAQDEPLLVLSGEDISRLTEPELVDLRDTLHKQVDTINIVAYVRDPAGYLTSAFQQRNRARFFAFKPEQFYSSYRQRFEKFITVFGRSAVQLWKFNPDKFPNGCVVRDFCQRLGLTIHPKTSARANPSLSQEALNLLYIFRKFGSSRADGLGEIDANVELIVALRTLKGSRFQLSATVLEPILRAHQADLDWISELLGESVVNPLPPAGVGISCEEDLLTVGPQAMTWLAQRLEMPLAEVEALGTPPDPKAVARVLARLRQPQPPAVGAGPATSV